MKRKISDWLYKLQCKMLDIEPLYIRINIDTSPVEIDPLDIGHYEDKIYTMTIPQIPDERYSYGWFKTIIYYLKKQAFKIMLSFVK